MLGLVIAAIGVAAFVKQASKKERARSLSGDGRYDHDGDALCVCGHTRDQHSPVKKAKPCEAVVNGDAETAKCRDDGDCKKFRKAKSGK